MEEDTKRSVQQLFDIEASTTTERKEHVRQLGMSKLDAVLSKAKAGQDPWEYQQLPRRGREQSDASDGAHDADVAEMGAWLERNKPLLLAGGLVVAQGGSWVLMKVCQAIRLQRSCGLFCNCNCQLALL